MKNVYSIFKQRSMCGRVTFCLCLLLIVLYGGGLALQAQSRYVTTYYSEQDGLSQGRVTNAAQAPNGLIWFSTWNGLNVFDGYRFSYYKDDGMGEEALSRNRIDVVRVSATGNVWCLCFTDLCLFDIHQRTFINVSKLLNKRFSRKVSINRILSLPNGFTWAADGSGSAYRINDTHPDQVEIYEDVFSSRRPDFVFLDAHGSEWLMTKEGPLQILPDGSRGFFFNLPKVMLHACEKDDRVWFFGGDGTAFYYDYVRKTHTYIDMSHRLGKLLSTQVLNDSVLLCSFRNAFVTVNTLTDSTRIYNLPELAAEADRVESFFVSSDTSCLILNRKGEAFRWRVGDPHARKVNVPADFVLTAKDVQRPMTFHDNANRLLLLTYDYKLFSFDEDANLIHTLTIGHGKNSVVRGAFQDSQDNLWVYGTKQDLCKITFLDNLFDKETFVAAEEVRASMIDSHNRLWMANRDGHIRLYDATTFRFLGSLAPDGKISSQDVAFDDRVAYTLFEDSDHYVWIGAKFRGLYRLEPVSADGSQYSPLLMSHADNNVYSLSDNDAYTVMQDSRGRIWVGCYTSGLNLVVNPHSSAPAFYNVRNRLMPNSGIFPPGVRCIKQVGDVLLVGSISGLYTFSVHFDRPEDIVFYLNRRGNNSTAQIGGNDVMDIYETSGGCIYVATFTGGLNRIESTELLSDTIRFRSYGLKDGAASDIALGITEDADHALWIVSESVIQRLNVESGTFENFGVDFFNAECRFTENPPIRLADDRILVTTQSGAVLITPSLAEKNQYIPPLILTEVTVNNRLMSFAGDHLVLQPDERNISFRFAALDFFNKAPIQYAYRLEGVDARWHYTSDMRSASYVNLKAGTYHFHVRSTNRFGAWENNELVCTVVCRPSFWETPWAKILYVLLAIVILTLVAYTYQHIYKLRHKLKVEKELTDVKLRFFTDISHELRTPITLIDGPVSEVIENVPLPEPYHHYLLTVQSNARRMLNLVNQILDFRKLQNGKMKLLVERTDVVESLRRIMEHFTAMAETHNIRFELQAVPSEVYLWVDGDKFEKIFMNLLSNAFKYTSDGKSILIRAFDADGRFHIAVQDEGCGIASDKIDHLFQRFDTVLQNNLFKPSSGIGLSLVKQFVELHHARIEVRSEEGVGSTFDVAFSYGKAHFTDEDPVEYLVNDAISKGGSADEAGVTDPASVESATSNGGARSGAFAVGDENMQREEIDESDYDSDQLSILVVEDNPDLCSFLTSILRKDYKVFVAGNGQQGLELAQREIPDLIVTDIAMPVMDGLEMTRRLKASDDTSHIPVIALTARVSLDDQLDGIRAGVRLYISKPFSATLLKAQIVMIFQNRQELQSFYMKQLRSDGASEPAVGGVAPSEIEIYSYDKQFIDKMVKCIEQNIAKVDYGIGDLACDMASSRSSFYRKAKALTGQSPMALVQEIRLKRAMQLLKYGHFPISEVAVMVGFADPKYFSRCFKKAMGMLPSEVPHEEQPERPKGTGE